MLLLVTLWRFRYLSGSLCLSCSCVGAMSVGFAVSLVRRLFLALCRALLAAPAVLRSFPCRWLPLGVSALFWPSLPTLLLRWWRQLGCHPFLVFSGLLLHGCLADVRWVMRPVSGCSRCGWDCSCYDCVVVPCGSPSFRDLLVVLSTLLWFSASVVGCALFTAWFHLLEGGCTSGLWCLRRMFAAKLVQ